MRVVVIGKGAREHALCWKLSQSSVIEEVFTWPGNVGIAQEFKIFDWPSDSTDYRGMAQFIKRSKIDFVVVGPEGPLSEGVARFALIVCGWGV